MQTGHSYEERHSHFDRFAEAVSNVTSRSVFFGVILLLGCGWLWAVIADEARVERIFVGLFTIVTLLKISLLANSDKRHLEALARRVDEHARQADEIRAAREPEPGPRLDSQRAPARADVAPIGAPSNQW